MKILGVSDLRILLLKKKEEKIKDIKEIITLVSFKLRNKKSSKKNLHRIFKKYNSETKNPCGSEGCELLIDTGTYLTYVPREMYKHFFRNFDSEEAEDCDQMNNLPDIKFVVIGEKENFDLILEPKDYVIKYTDERGYSTCVLGISPDDEVSHLITIG